MISKFFYIHLYCTCYFTNKSSQMLSTDFQRLFFAGALYTFHHKEALFTTISNYCAEQTESLVSESVQAPLTADSVFFQFVKFKTQDNLMKSDSKSFNLFINDTVIHGRFNSLDILVFKYDP